jgi:DNA-binding Lrp family transcriptional regulator
MYNVRYPSLEEIVATTELNSVDRALIDELKKDCRATNRALARALDVTEQTVASRVRRLEKNKMLKVIAVVGRTLHGYNSRIHFGILTSGRSPRQVATELANIPNVIMIAVCFGRYELVGVLLAHTDQDAMRVLAERFGKVKGIQNIELLIDVEHLHYTVDYAMLRGADSSLPTLPLEASATSPDLDERDIAIVREVLADARLSFREIGRRLEVSEGFVRARLREMQELNILRFQVVVDHSISPNNFAAYIALKADLAALDQIGQVLVALPECTSVTQVLGGSNYICTIQSPTHEDLAHTILEKIGPLDGIRGLDILEVIDVVKQDNSLLATDI